MTDSFFYSNVSENIKNNEFLKRLEMYSKDFSKQIYVINRPLTEKKYDYDYEDSVVILIPNYKIIFLDFGGFDEGFQNYFEDFIEDLGYLSDKFGYKKILGRPREWKSEFFKKLDYEDIKDKEIESILAENKLPSKEKERDGQYLISLLTGSINDIDRISGSFPDTILEKIKKKIILFDGDQTRFIYEEPIQKRIIIQGLAGTGKTELLLHKLKDLYLKETNCTIVFTCHNRILAESLRTRIPDFFDFMKVNEQIKWNERLWAMRGWGSQSYKNSGLYSFICNHYNIPFIRYSYRSTFDIVCTKALEELNKIEDFTPYFDYILIDESQDFPESFFELCEKVTKKNVYIAGDIFQNVFDEEIVSKVSPDFLLNKCYRTNPKTLMFAHSIGMGLFEEKLRWLNDEEWEACGYVIDKKNDKYYLSRKPLRIFEELEEQGVESIKLYGINNQKYVPQIISIIEEIVEQNATVEPDDIGIVFLENLQVNYKMASKLQVLIKQRFDWDVNIGYETKDRYKDTVFISNKNNIKGLEFPFIICIAQNNLTRDLRERNSIYMMLTRSFITSYFIVSSNNNEKILDSLNKGIKSINRNRCLIVKEPDPEEKERLRNAIIKRKNHLKSQKEIVEEIMDEIGVKREYRESLHSIIETFSKDGFDEEKVYEIIKTNYRLMGSKEYLNE